MYVEYHWMAETYKFRLGDTFTDIRGWLSADTMDDVKYILRAAGLMLGRQTDTRTWEILPNPISTRRSPQRPLPSNHPQL